MKSMRRCSAGFQTCCVAGFQTRSRPEILPSLGSTTACRFGNRRYSRFGNRRYDFAQRLHASVRSSAGFTMVEIALCIAIIGFALVAIIGVLPSAMRVQQDNRADTIIDQDGIYLMEAIRHGSQGLDDLTNYIRNTAFALRDVIRQPGGGVSTNFLGFKAAAGTGQRLIGFLSAPRTNDNNGLVRVEAEMRSISGAAVEKDQSSAVNFEYLLVSEVVPFSSFDWPTAFPTVDPNSITNIARDLQNNLYEVRLTFRWPLISANPNQPARVGNNRKVLRAMVSGSLTNMMLDGPQGLPYFFFQPTTFAANPAP